MNSQKMFCMWRGLFGGFESSQKRGLGLSLSVLGLLGLLTFVGVLLRNQAHRSEIQAKKEETFAVALASPLEFLLFEAALNSKNSGKQKPLLEGPQKGAVAEGKDFDSQRYHLGDQEILSLFDYFSTESFELAKVTLGGLDWSEERYHAAVMEGDVRVLNSQGLELARRWSVLKRSGRLKELGRQLLGTSPEATQLVSSEKLIPFSKAELTKWLKTGAGATLKDCSWLRLEKAFRIAELHVPARPFVKDYFVECQKVNLALSPKYLDGVLKAWNH